MKFETGDRFVIRADYKRQNPSIPQGVIGIISSRGDGFSWSWVVWKWPDVDDIKGWMDWDDIDLVLMPTKERYERLKPPGAGAPLYSFSADPNFDFGKVKVPAYTFTVDCGGLPHHTIDYDGKLHPKNHNPDDLGFVSPGGTVAFELSEKSIHCYLCDKETRSPKTLVGIAYGGEGVLPNTSRNLIKVCKTCKDLANRYNRFFNTKGKLLDK